MKFEKVASWWALFFVIAAIGGSFFVWLKDRPSFLLYQAHSQAGQGNSTAVVSEYKKLLSKPNLSPQKEIELRQALGEFYLESVQENSVQSDRFIDNYAVDHPFIKSAKKEFTRILEIDPDNGMAHYNLGRIYWFQKLETFAFDEFNKSLTFSSKYPESLTYLARFYLDRGDVSKSRELALQALALNPGYDRARLVLMSAYKESGDLDKALWEYEKLSSQFASLPWVLAQSADLLLQLSQWDEALNLIQRAVASDSQNGWIRLEFGKTLMKLGRLEEARGQISQAGSFLPHSIWPYVWLSKLNYLSGECELNNRIKNIIGVWSKWEWSYLVNAWNNLCEGNDEVALSQLSECLSRHPEFREAIELKSRILLDKGMFDELGRHLRPLLDQNVNEPLAYSFLAESFFWQKNMLMADDMGQSKIKVSDRNPWPHVWQGFLLLEKNQNKQAQESFELAEKYGGQDSTLQGFLTLGELGNNQIDKAWIRVTRVLSQYPRDAFLWFARGEVESKMDRMVEAERSYSTSIQLKPYFLQPALALLKLSPSELTLSNALKINAKHSEVLEWRRKIRPRN